jgi:hypothetical protein
MYGVWRKFDEKATWECCNNLLSLKLDGEPIEPCLIRKLLSNYHISE